MNKKNFRLLFPRYIYIIAAVTILICLSTLIYNLLKLLALSGLPSYDVVVDTISIVLAVLIIAVVIYSVLYSGFSFNKDKLVFHMSVFTVIIPYENMLLLRHDPKTNMMLLYYNIPTEESVENIKYAIINIKLDTIESFIDLVKQSNRRTIYEIFDKENETKQN